MTMQDTSTTATNGSHAFQAEIRQLLDIVVHSLYTDREIFVRELISNASDAMEKMRHLQGVEKDVCDPAAPMEILISTDESAGTITIADRGLGMTRDDLARNLGTIAHSGTRQYLKNLQENGGNAGTMIGQFGVGFYSAFMVASEVRVFTRSWHVEGESLVWTSDGSGGYTIGEAPGQERGCRIVIQLKEDATEFARESRLKKLIETYSNFVGFPILLNGKRVNEVEALWLKNKNDVSEEEYTGFYKFTAHAFDEPAYRLHFSADAPLSINALIFLPTENPERWGFGQVDPGVALYCRKVLIDPQPKGLLPDWLRFAKGVIDSEDLPLNISRETMQDSALVKKLGDVICKRVIKMLENEAAADSAKFTRYYRNFERFFKEGVATDMAHRDALARLLRFESTLCGTGEPTSLADYLARAKDGQDAIYYLVGTSRELLENSPYLEAFKARGIEVLLMLEPIDQYVVDALGTFDGKSLVSVDKAGLELDDHPAGDGTGLDPALQQSLAEYLQTTLGDRVAKVAAGKRLVDSPVVALVPQDALNANMRRMMKAMDDGFNDAVKVELEINPRHPLIKNLAHAMTARPELADLVARQLLDNALLAAGLLEDTRPSVERVNTMMAKLLVEEKI